MKAIILATIVSAFASAALCSTTNIGFGPEGPISRSEVSYWGFKQINDPQRQPEWCWAASVSDVFRFYKYNISQETIVRAVYGRLVDLPAMSAKRIAELLNRDWIDDDGKKFRSRLVAAYDADAGVNAINNSIIINELRNEHPLVVCNTHHCMVATEITYTPLRVLSVGVFDPWPLGPETHDLPPLEIRPAHMGGQLMFVAAVRVTPIDAVSPDDSSAGEAGDNSAQDVTGTWSGNIMTPMGPLPFVIHISKDGDDFSATADSPAQNSFGMSVDTVEFNGDRLKFSIDALDVAFQGKLSGSSRIGGIFTQHGTHMSLSLRKSSD